VLALTRLAFRLVYCGVVALFAACGLALVALAAGRLLAGLGGDGGSAGVRVDAVLEAVGLLTVAVAALELGQTVLEEEVQRAAHMSAPTRVRRFLSRFLVVVVAALGTEALVLTFRFARESPGRLPEAAAVGGAAALLLAGWGVFVRLNTRAEELEPEAMARAKQEDVKVDPPAGRAG
jgi:hypothetical protein